MAQLLWKRRTGGEAATGSKEMLLPSGLLPERRKRTTTRDERIQQPGGKKQLGTGV